MLQKLYNKMKFLIYLFPLIVVGCNTSYFDLALKGDTLNLERNLLKNPKIVNEKDRLDKTMMHYAVCSGNKNVLELLYLYGARLEEKDITGMTPLHVCAMWDLNGPARWLVSRGADINVKDNFGDSLLHTSAVFGTDKIGKYLKSLGLSLEDKNREGLTPVDLAKRHKKDNWIREVKGE